MSSISTKDFATFWVARLGFRQGATAVKSGHWQLIVAGFGAGVESVSALDGLFQFLMVIYG